jgi:hypothetical protein
MADEAFALSPISARAALPSEQDYDAISQAFMETSRGRWFLGEYAKRNRNADTRMVLDAVERIEQTIVAQRQSADESGLDEALSAIRRAVDEAAAAAAVAVESLAADENLAPIRKGARIIREISWRWREIGADSRICDLLDSQVSAIEGACGQVASASPQEALGAAFDLIRERLAEFGDDDRPSSQATEKSFQSPPAVAVETDPADSPAAEAAPAEAIVEMAEAEEAMAEVAEVSVGVADAALDATPEAADEKLESAEAYDEALLDMVALEMAAPDPADSDDGPDAAADEIPETASPAEPVMVTDRPEPAELPPVQPSFKPSLQDSLRPSLQDSLQPPLQASPQPSLGSSLLAHGIVRKPVSSASDPLAPIRRMSQAEKIAFFS